MFFSAGIVLLTLVINGTTTGFVIRKLGLANESEMSKLMLRKVLDKHDKMADEFILKWKRERSEHGDKAGNEFYDEVLDLGQLKKNKEVLIKDLYLTKINKMYPKELEEFDTNNSSVNSVHV